MQSFTAHMPFLTATGPFIFTSVRIGKSSYFVTCWLRFYVGDGPFFWAPHLVNLTLHQFLSPFNFILLFFSFLHHSAVPEIQVGDLEVL